MANRKRCEPLPVWWRRYGLCSGRTNRVGLSFGYAELAFGSVPDSFSLVPFFWRGKRKEHNSKREEWCPLETHGFGVLPKLLFVPLRRAWNVPQKEKPVALATGFCVVGVDGFEPPTLCL
jgi:hypothetical protein